MLFRRSTEHRVAQSSVTRILSTTTLFTGLVMASYTHALGLGELRSTSFLGQPLDATIGVLLDGEDYGPEDIRVRQLNSEEASKLGIDLAGYQSYYRLTPVINQGRLEIDLISRDTVNEPFLNMLVELKWPKGTVYREYTLFLDPMTLRESTRPEPQNSLPEQSSPPKPRATTAPASNIQAGADTYPVKSGDSLSMIASRLVDGTDTSRRDMMQWLLENNPRAFINGEMNRLLAGVTLTLPAGNVANDITRKPSTQTAPQPQAEAPPVEPAPAPKAPVAEPKQRLTIVTPASDQAGNAKGQVPESENLEALQMQMAVTNEVVERLRRENEAMSKRLIAIEKSGYVTSLERLVLLKEEEIATLQQDLAEKDQSAPAPEAKAPVAEPEPVAAQTVSAPDQSSTIQQLWLAIIVLLIACAGMFFFLLRWRAQESKPEPISETAEPEQESDLLKELDDIIDSQSAFDITASSTVPDNSGDSDVFEAINQPPSNRFDRRPDDIVKQSIQAKTQTYSPPELQDSDKNYHDEVDELISDAIEAANRGAFDVAEALLVAERTHQARDPSGDRGEIDSRIELALEFVEQLRQGQHSAG